MCFWSFLNKVVLYKLRGASPGGVRQWTKVGRGAAVCSVSTVLNSFNSKREALQEKRRKKMGLKRLALII